MKRSERHKIKRDDFSTFMVSFLRKLKPYWKEISLGVAVLLIALIGWLSYRAYMNSRIEKANFYLGQSVYYNKDVDLSSFPDPIPTAGKILEAKKMADRGKFKEAISFLSKAKPSGRMKSYLLFSLGSLYYETNDCGKAIEMWNKISQEDENFPYDAALAFMGRCYKNLGKEKQASATFNQILSLYKNSPYAAEANFRRGE